jgi:hypothetical protein
MSQPEGTGSERERDQGEDIVLPSWIDAAISRTRDGSEPLESQASPLPEDAVEPMAEPPAELLPEELPTQEYPRAVIPLTHPTESPSEEPFPSFLDRRGSMEYETERIADDPSEYPTAEMPREAFLSPPTELEPLQEQPPQPPPAPEDFLRRRVTADFEAQRAAIVSEAMAADPAPLGEPIPLPVAPSRRPMASAPWLMAALFFAAAAIVLAILIWLRPLPK